jgi:hypothetical protein
MASESSSHIIRAMRCVLAGLAILALGACSSSQPPTFALQSASTDATYWCPGGASDAPYDLHASVGVRNGTASAVTITSMTAELTLEAVGGSWLEKVGERYEASRVAFTPTSIGPNSTATVNAVIPSTCTSAMYGTSSASYGDYRVTLHVTTSGHTYSIASRNLHRILAT